MASTRLFALLENIGIKFGILLLINARLNTFLCRVWSRPSAVNIPFPTIPSNAEYSKSGFL
jgi:hypothetical protein